MLQDQLAHLGVILPQHAHDFLGFSGLGERGEAAQIEKADRDLAAMGLQRVVRPACHDELGELRREEALQSAEPLDQRDLLRDALLERAVPLLQLPRVLRFTVAQPLLLQAGADAGPQQYGVEGLGKVVLRPQLDAAHDALDLVDCRDHQHGDVPQARPP